MAVGREQTAASRAAASGLAAAYPLRTRVAWAVAAILIGVFVAGFWNYQTVDGFGRGVVAGNTIGDTATLAGTYASNGAAFGLLFAAVAGLAATFTACNCVVFAMLPGLACATDKASSRTSAIRALGVFAVGVTLVGALYGLYVGSLGAEGARAFNERGARIAQAETVFTSLGVLMLLWATLSFGFLDRFVGSIPAEIRAFFSAPLTRAGIMGLMVGTFAVGRPYPVFRDLLAYAATSQSPLYGALIMSIQGLGQIAVMVLLFLALAYLLRDRLTRWVTEQPQQSAFVTGVALFIGGASFVYYWGLAFGLGIGGWGFKLGLY
jgi:cytochrome c biogenesis protein CcdA